MGAEVHFLNLQKKLNRFLHNFFCILGIGHCQIQKISFFKLSQIFSTPKLQSPGTAPKIGKTHFLAILTLQTPINTANRDISYLLLQETYFGTFELFPVPLGAILGQNGGQKGHFIQYLSKTAPNY